jgi:hypothetical protein
LFTHTLTDSTKSTAGQITLTATNTPGAEASELILEADSIVLDSTVTAATLNSTTIDTTNIEVTNVKAKDGTAAITLANSTGVATLSANPIINAGTANGVPYLNGSKVLTTGSALTFDGSIVSNTGVGFNVNNANALYRFQNGSGTRTGYFQVRADAFEIWSDQAAVPMVFGVANAEKMRLTSTGTLNIVGAGTAGSTQAISFSGSTPVDTLVTTSGGNVGIGTQSPTTAYGYTKVIDIAGSFPGIKFTPSGASTFGFQIGAGTNGFQFYDVAASAERMRIDSSGALIAKPAAGTGAVFNEDGVDADFRVESDTQTHMLFVDAGNNRVGIGTSSPGGVFHTVATAAGAASIGGILQNADNSLNSEVRLLFAPNLSTNWGNRQAYISGVNVVGGGTATELAFGSAANGVAPVERMRIDKDGNVRVGTAALATTATNGFLYIPTCAGTPTGTPTAITGLAPMVIDSTNNKLYIYSGGAWVALN